MNSLSSHENEIYVAPPLLSVHISCMEILSSLMYINMIFLCECFIVLLPTLCTATQRKIKKNHNIYVAHTWKLYFPHVKYTMKHKVKLFNNGSDILPSEEISLSPFFLSRRCAHLSCELSLSVVSFFAKHHYQRAYTDTHMRRRGGSEEWARQKRGIVPKSLARRKICVWIFKKFEVETAL